MKIISIIVGLCALVAAPLNAQQAPAHDSPHKQLKQTCEKCHVATSFRDVTFDHTGTRFPLEGHHSDVKCLSCHSVEDFSKTQSNCATCHQDPHKGRMGPNCERCHSSDGWRVFEAEEIHATTNFPLLGRHVTMDCESCHTGAKAFAFRGTSSRCIDCHRAEYESTTSPSHNGFSADCQQCHQPAAWTPATMVDHDGFFPIFSGRHNRVWDSCAQCHTAPGNNKVVSCVTCHEHAQPEMDTHHQGFPGYAYASAACLACHPTGDAMRFGDHDAQFFPIFSGRHNGTWDTCAQCHTTQGYSQNFSCLACHDHAQPTTDPVHQGFAGYSYTSSACFTCHPTGEAGEFLEHDAQFFPIFSGPHSRNWDSCATCHNVPTNRAIFTCFSCHEHDKVPMDDKHSAMGDYSYDSQACFNCHPNGRHEGN